MKHASKSEFIKRTQQEWQLLWDAVDLLLEMSPPKKQQEQLRKTLAHLYAWQVLLAGWLKTGADGDPDLPAAGFKWNQTPALNAVLDKQYADMDYATVRRRLRSSHTRLMKRVENLTEAEIMKPNQYAWTGTSTLCGYISANTCSHYRWAQKKLKRITKSVKRHL